MDATPPKTSGEPSGPAPASFAVTHCRKCAAGWTRTLSDAGVVTVCLLDREPVLKNMTHCDRYEEKKAEAA
jgi:hypothetical protein